MCDLWMNYEWIKIQLKIIQNSMKNELILNLKWIENELTIK
jgi:hypothetical protein